MTHRPVRPSTRELRARIDDPGMQLVDVRPIDAYNGWQLDGEARGGHIRGARALPFAWSAYLDWIEIVRAKGLQPDRCLVVYGRNDDETEAVARLFTGRGSRTWACIRTSGRGGAGMPHCPWTTWPGTPPPGSAVVAAWADVRGVRPE